MKNEPIIIIGAARSGTKIVRDVISTHPLINKIPYDVNFIWRTGNETFPHDELTAANFSIRSHRRIDSYLSKYQKDVPFLIEKTVSNTIRIPFLLSHYPNAKFIFLYRNGMDVSESVMRQWTTPNDSTYLLKKMLHVPGRELIRYGMKFLARNLFRKRESFFWGVQYPGLHQHLKEGRSLEELVAFQWQYCVEKMEEDKIKIESGNLIEIKYEEFIFSPEQTLIKVLKFIDNDLDFTSIDTSCIKKGNVGKSKTVLTTQQNQTISNIISKTMTKLNYPL